MGGCVVAVMWRGGRRGAAAGPRAASLNGLIALSDQIRPRRARRCNESSDPVRPRSQAAFLITPGDQGLDSASGSIRPWARFGLGSIRPRRPKRWPRGAPAPDIPLSNADRLERAWPWPESNDIDTGPRWFGAQSITERNVPRLAGADASHPSDSDAARWAMGRFRQNSRSATLAKVDLDGSDAYRAHRARHRRTGHGSAPTARHAQTRPAAPPPCPVLARSALVVP